MEAALTLFYNIEFTLELVLAQLLFLRYTERKPHFALRGALAVLACYICSEWFSYAMTEYIPINLILRFIGIWLLTIGCILFCYRCQAYKAILFGIGGYTLQHLAFAIHEVLKAALSVFFHIDLPKTNVEDVKSILLLVFLYALVYGIAYKVLVQKISKAECTIKSWNVLVLSGEILLIVIVLSIYCYNLGLTEQLVCRGLSAMSCLIGLSMLKELIAKRQLEQDLLMIQQQSAMKVNYYELLRDNIEATNIRCHDFKHQLAQLRSRQGDVPESVLSELQQSINIYDSIAKTGNEILDIVLTETGLRCQKEGIRFTYVADVQQLNMLEEKDIYSLFGNAIDNAIEAVCKLSTPEKRIINLSVICSGPVLNIHLYNYYEAELVFSDGLPQSTKEDRLAHGYGMKSLQLIAEKYDGVLLVTTSNQIFDLNIALPLQLE